MAAERVALVDRLADLVAKERDLAQCESEAAALLGTIWCAERTDFAAILRSGEWLERAIACGLGTSVEQALFLAGRKEIAARLPEKLRANADRARAETLALLDLLDVDIATAF